VSGKAIQNETLICMFFSGVVEIFFGQRWLSPIEKNGPYAYVFE